MKIISLTTVDEDDQTLVLEHAGKFFKLNLPTQTGRHRSGGVWADSEDQARLHGLNLVFGLGCHYE